MTHDDKMRRFVEAGLYLVTCESLSKGRSTLSIVRAALAAGTRLIQLREKELPLPELVRLAGDLRRLTDSAQALLIINDRLDVALAVGADGVHLGQDDLSVSAARRIAPHLIIGASTHSIEEVRAAEVAGVSYVNIGPIFATDTKKWDRDFIGVEGIGPIAKGLSVPFTVMGGIKKCHVPELVRAGASAIAIVTAVTAAENPEHAARELLDEIANARSNCVPQENPKRPRIVLRRQAKRILPVALMVENRQCLVIGGGTVAARKAEALIEAGANVLLVSPEVGERARVLRSAPGMTILQRKYVPEDLDRKLFLVITATDDHALNREILTACQSRGLLCACPDTGWENGDFMSPASFKHGDLTVSVSTGGASCRRSRLIKESLARHADALGQADLLVIGTDHRFADLVQRESLHLSGVRLEETAEMVRQVLGIHEFMLLCTCNRIELVGLASATPAVLSIVNKILGLHQLDGRFYVHHGRYAFRHLALVASGLLSQTPGETRICAQVKTALEGSRRAGSSAGVLQDWVGRVLHIAKAIRRATHSVLEGTEIEGLSREFLERELGGVRDRRILVIGSGAIGKDVAEKLASGGAMVSCCYHSNVPVFSDSLAEKVVLFPLASLADVMRNQDAIICAASGDVPVLTAEHGRLLNADRRVVVMDLGVPRNVASDFVGGSSLVTVVNLDDIKRSFRHDTRNVQEARKTGERIISEHMEEYEHIVANIQGGV